MVWMTTVQKYQHQSDESEYSDTFVEVLHDFTVLEIVKNQNEPNSC